MRKRFVLFSIAPMVVVPCVARAGEVDFAFAGSDARPTVGTSTRGYTYTYTYIDNGTISVTYNGSNPAVLTPSNINAFTLNRKIDFFNTVVYPTSHDKDYIIDYGPGGYGQSYTQNAAQLSSMSISVSSAGAVTALSLATIAVLPGGTYTQYPNAFNASTGVSGNFTDLTTTSSGSYPSGIFTLGNMAQVGSGPRNLIWNDNGASGNGVTWDTGQLNWNNGTGLSTYSDGNMGGDNVAFNDNNNGNYYVSIPGTEVTTPYPIPDTVTPASTTVNTNSSTGYTFGGMGSIGGTGGLTKLGTGLLTIDTVNVYSGTTTVSGGTVVLGVAGALPAGTNLTINGSNASVVAQSLGAAYALQVGTLNISSGSLDLTNNDLIVRGSSIAVVTTAAAAGYSNGLWNGSTGLISSTAAANTIHLTALGVIINDTGANTGAPAGKSIYPTLGGASTLDGDVLVKYTYYGDANLSGSVDGSDYSLIDNGYFQHLTGWYNGDFNYDGVVNGSDYTLIDNAFNSQGAQIAAEAVSATAEIDSASAVPEPSLGIAAISVISLLGRRRTRS